MKKGVKRSPPRKRTATERNPTPTADMNDSRAVRHRTPIVRKALLNTAAALFAERGFVGTNLRDVADALGMSRPGLYYHFSSKEKLLETIVEEVTLSAERQLALVSQERDTDPEDALRLVVTITTKWILEHQTLFRVLDRSDTDLPRGVRESNDAAKRAILEHFVRIIERGIAAGKFRPMDAHIAALAISGMRNWCAWWYKPDGRLSADQIVEVVTDMAVRSVVRSDAHRSRGERVDDSLRILQEDVAHLTRLIRDLPKGGST
jgi:AcrR family transcriptional regulator